MHLRPLVAIAVLIATLATFTAPNHHVSATVPPPPTCTDPRPGGQTYPATAFLTSPGTLIGTSERDVLVGSTGADVIKGLGGDDLICFNGGDDIIDAGTGNDIIDALDDETDGSSRVHGGTGNDWMDVHGDAHGDGGNDVISGDLGTFWGDSGNDTLGLNGGLAVYGGSGHDIINAINTPIADGGSGNDLLTGEYPATVLLGGSGNDTLRTFDENGVNSMDGGSGQDTCTPYTASTRSCETLI